MQSHSTFADPFFSHFKILNIVDLPGYPLYAPNEDIYKRAVKVEDIDFEEIRNIKHPSKMNEKTFADDPTGEDLDVPGSELDDDQEDIGNEDEENNSYSLAQDEQVDLENEEE